MRTQPNHGPAVLVCLVVGAFFWSVERSFVGPAQARADGVVPFAAIVLDAAGPRGEQYYGMHIKAVGDLNGDGYPDAIVAGATEGQPLVWYEMPAGTRHVISTLGGWSTDAAVGDIDNDGDNDIVISSWYRSDAGIEWFENLGDGADWARHTIGEPRAHDLELVDLDLDGDLDLVTRLQEGQGNAIQVWRQDGPQTWVRASITAGVPTGEGLATADIDRDGDPDVIVNGVWFENPRDIIGGTWAPHAYTSSWTEPDTIVATGDINRDGRIDIALTPSEAAGEGYRISWFEAPSDPRDNTEWIEHVVADDVEAVHHSLQLADFDNDGDLDLATAAMHQGANPAVVLYTNVGTGGRGTEWTAQSIANTSSHSIKAADFDRDGDVDLFGADWSDSSTVHLWRNDLNERLPLDRWARHVIDDARPWNAVFIDADDIDGDGLPDVIAGGWWYRNPGDPAGRWQRNTIGSPLNNMAAVFDYDQDGDLDILGTPWAGSGADPAFVWARNDGFGSFAILDNVPAGEGDFLQGVAVGRFARNGPIETALSWHDGTGNGIQMLSTPADPSTESWSWARLSDVDQEEDLSAGDIDRDGDLDLLLGTRWLRNDGGSWSVHTLSDTPDQPDRNKLADVNKDGRLDAIVGFLGISTPARLVWYEQPQDPQALWTEHVIATVVGPMSLDVADIDLDGDVDVVIGEHNLDQPDTARTIVFENADGLGTTWAARIVHTGDEHHDGTQLVDIDRDGDLDIISVGWGHSRVLLYQNLAMESGERITGPVPSVPEPPLPPSSEPDPEPSGPGPGPEPEPEPEPPDQPGPAPGEDVLGEPPAVCGACGTGAGSALVVGLVALSLLKRRRHAA